MRNKSCAEGVVRVDEADAEEVMDPNYLGRQLDPNNTPGSEFIRGRTASWTAVNNNRVALTDQRLSINV